MLNRVVPLLISTFVLLSCGIVLEVVEEKIRPPEEKPDYYKMALSKLESAEYVEAMELFSKLMKEEGEKREYLIGYALSKMALTLSEFPRKLKEQLDRFSGVLRSAPPNTYLTQQRKLSQKQVRKGLISSFIETTIRSLVLDGVEIALPYYEKGLEKVDETFVLDVKGIPIAFEEEPLYFKGKFGDVEAWEVYAITQYLRGILYLILSVNFDLRIGDMLEADQFVKEKGGWYMFFADHWNVGFPVIAYLLNKNTNFLRTLYKDYIRESLEYLKKSMEAYGEMLSIIPSYMRKKERRIGFMAEFDETFSKMTLILKRGNEEKKYEFMVGAWVKDARKIIDEIKGHLERGDPPYVDCEAAAWALGSFFYFSSSALFSAGSEDVSETLPNIGEALRGASTLTQLIQNLVSFCIATKFDFRNFPNLDVRGGLPVWTFTSAEVGEDNFWFEGECGLNSLNFRDEDKKELIDPANYPDCKPRVPLEDSKHFTAPITIGTGIYEIAGVPVTQPAGECEADEDLEYCLDLWGGINPFAGKGIPEDGIATRRLYYLWQDPSFGSTVYIDFSKIQSKRALRMIQNCGVEPKGVWKPKGPEGICVFNVIIRLLELR